jgi:hypothetical protein
MFPNTATYIFNERCSKKASSVANQHLAVSHGSSAQLIPKLIEDKTKVSSMGLPPTADH